MKIAERMKEDLVTVREKTYIGIISGNQITAMEVKEVLEDGFVGCVVGDPSEMPITYPILPFTKVKNELAKVIEEKLDGMKAEVEKKKKEDEKSDELKVVN